MKNKRLILIIISIIVILLSVVSVLIGIVSLFDRSLIINYKYISDISITYGLLVGFGATMGLLYNIKALKLKKGGKND